MSTIRQFGLVGVGSNIQLGKGGNHIDSTSGVVSVFAADNATYAVTRVATPVGANDAATKQYVDSAIQGLDVKASVRAATTANITLSGLQTVDTVSLNAGDRVLVKNQTDETTNGIYVVASGAWVRSDDANTSAELENAFVFVEEGSQANSGWTQTTDLLASGAGLGTSNVVWTQFSGAGTYTAGSGLSLAGGVFSANVDNVTIAIVNNDLVVNSNSTAGQTLISTGTPGTAAVFGRLDLSNPAVFQNSLPVELGGTGISGGYGLLFANNTSPFETVSPSAAGLALLSTGSSTVPEYGAIDLSNSSTTVVENVLGLVNGGTGNALTVSEGSIAYSDSNGVQFGSVGTAGQILLSGGSSAPTWANLSDLAVTSVQNIGTGTGNIYSNVTNGVLSLRDLLAGSNAISISTVNNDVVVDVVQANIQINNLNGVLSVTKGGTGLNTVDSGMILYTNAPNQFVEAPITSLGLNLLASSTQSAAQGFLGLTIGTNVEAWSASLDALAALNGTGILVQTGANTFTEVEVVADTGAYAGAHITNPNGTTGNITIGVDIDGQSALGSMTGNEEVLVFDPISSTNKKVTVSEITALIPAVDPGYLLADLTYGSASIGTIPSSAIVTRVTVSVTAAYDAGIDMGITAASGPALVGSSDVDLQTPGVYFIEMPGALVDNSGLVSVAFSGSPTMGASTVFVEYKLV